MIINRIPRNYSATQLPSALSNMLLHLDDNLTDSATGGNAPHTVSSTNSTSDTSTKKWGAGSRAFNGTTAYLSVPDSTDWDIIGNLDNSFTIDFQVKHADHAGQEGYMSHVNDGDNFWWIEHKDGSGMRFQGRFNGGAFTMDTTYGGEITDTDWHHIAFIVVGNGSSFTVGLYKDGTQIGYDTETNTDTIAGSLYLARYGSTPFESWFAGNIDEVRISATNHFNASPNATPNDTITVPTGAYS